MPDLLSGGVGIPRFSRFSLSECGASRGGPRATRGNWNKTEWEKRRDDGCGKQKPMSCPKLLGLYCEG